MYVIPQAQATKTYHWSTHPLDLTLTPWPFDFATCSHPDTPLIILAVVLYSGLPCVLTPKPIIDWPTHWTLPLGPWTWTLPHALTCTYHWSNNDIYNPWLILTPLGPCTCMILSQAQANKRTYHWSTHLWPYPLTFWLCDMLMLSPKHTIDHTSTSSYTILGPWLICTPLGPCMIPQAQVT